ASSYVVAFRKGNLLERSLSKVASFKMYFCCQNHVSPQLLSLPYCLRQDFPFSIRGLNISLSRYYGDAQNRIRSLESHGYIHCCMLPCRLWLVEFDSTIEPIPLGFPLIDYDLIRSAVDRECKDNPKVTLSHGAKSRHWTAILAVT